MGETALLVHLNLIFWNGKSISEVGFDFPTAFAIARVPELLGNWVPPDFVKLFGQAD